MKYKLSTFFTPSLIALTLQTAVVLLIFVIWTYNTLIERLTDGKFDPSEGASAGVLIDEQVNSFLQVLDGSGTSAVLITMVFWAAAGAFIYMFVFWAVQGLNTVASSASISKNYTHGRQYNDSSFWSGFIARTVFRLLSGVFFLAMLIGLFSFVLPLFVTLYRTALAGMPNIIFLAQMVGSILATTLYVHLMTVVARFIALKPRLYGSSNLL